MKIADSIWFFDIDDTLIDTAGTSSQASEGIKKIFSERFDRVIGRSVAEKFDLIFSQILSGYRVKNDNDWKTALISQSDFKNLINRIENLQPQVKKEWGSIKKWSREVFIKLAADEAGVDVDPQLVTKAANAYWNTLTEKIVIFSSALTLIKKLTTLNRPVFLITSSDGRLKMNEDHKFIYDPKYSEKLKRQRIELLKKRGLHFDALTIGDPEDKPDVGFFMKGIKKAEEVLNSKIHFNNCVMVGDSFAGDLQTPKEKMGFGLVVLVEKGRKNVELVDNNLLKVGNLEKTLDFVR